MTPWTGRARAGGVVAVSLAVVLVAALVSLAAGQPALGVVLLVVGAALFAFVSVTVTVDDRGLSVRSGTLRFIRVQIPLERIDSVEAIDVNPWRWGGWGYRGSVRLFRSAAWVVRGGPGMKVVLNDGRVFVVTVDDAEAGAPALGARLTSTRP